MAPDTRRLAARLQDAAPRRADRHAVILPDLFVDHFIPVPSVAGFVGDTREIAARGGGNRPTHPQFHRLGGNAANTAYALARLGVPTTLIAHTDTLGAHLLQTAADGLPLHTGRVHDHGHASTTAALEFAAEDANVMLSDAGPLATLGPDDLDDGDWQAIDDANLVLLTNWSQTFVHGNALLSAVIERARKAGATTLLDTGDPSHRSDALAGLLGLDALRRKLDAWGLNANEARLFAAALTGGPVDATDTAVETLSRHTSARIDLHTSQGAESLRDGKRIAHAPSFDVRPRRRTGAGDAWNAGSILATLLDLGDAERLTTGNAVAALTLDHETLMPPDLPTLVRFLGSTRAAPHRP